jgi:hypothetical protein
VSVPRTEDLKYATYLLGMRFPGSLKYEIVQWQYQSNWRIERAFFSHVAEAVKNRDNSDEFSIRSRGIREVEARFPDSGS